MSLQGAISPVISGADTPQQQACNSLYPDQLSKLVHEMFIHTSLSCRLKLIHHLLYSCKHVQDDKQLL